MICTSIVVFGGLRSIRPQSNYHRAFAVLLVPALINLSLVLTARLLYPRPQDMETGTQPIVSHGLPRVFWIYLTGATLVAAGFADYPLIAYHFQQAGTVPGEWVAIFYSIAMAVSGTGSLVLRRLFDRWGFRVLLVLTIVGAGFAPLVFLGGFWVAMMGAAVWGIGMVCMNRLSPLQYRQWYPQNAVLLRSDCSPLDTASPGSRAAP